jgi:hypothetical protein
MGLEARDKSPKSKKSTPESTTSGVRGVRPHPSSRLDSATFKVILLLALEDAMSDEVTGLVHESQAVKESQAVQEFRVWGH